MRSHRTATHWGVYDVIVEDGHILDVRGHPEDCLPSPIGASLTAAQDFSTRIHQPMVRRGYLDHGPRKHNNRRGKEAFVAVSWNEALDLAAHALADVKKARGPEGLFAGSYGWSSAGRFHHAQSQIHRFMNLHGGYVRSVNSYSCGAMEVILPHVLCGMVELRGGMPQWNAVENHGELVLSFGGLSTKNMQVNPGGISNHSAQEEQMRCRRAGVSFINVGPVREDIADQLDAEWIAPRPGSDVALMLGMAHTMIAENLHDRDFLERCCVGFGPFKAYVMGESDGAPKSAEWASTITEISADRIRDLARLVASKRTLITVSWSLQRADHGEQVHWMAVTLSAMSGSLGQPGGGFGTGYGAVHLVGSKFRPIPVAPLPQGDNACKTFIPVARIADMLLSPGQRYDYDGKDLVYPDIDLVYWCGGNPFHHHQDLNRLERAWQNPSTIIVHEPWWNALARRADIVFPVTTMLERNDFAIGVDDNLMIAMRKAIEPIGQSRNDYDVFTSLAERLGFAAAFTESRNEMAWIETLYERSRDMAKSHDVVLPDFQTFWRQGEAIYPDTPQPAALCENLRRDPAQSPITTPSGKVEIYSETIASFGYDDCKGHPAWFEPIEWLGSARAKQFPLHLISNQPKSRLHSQFDNGVTSRASKIAGREPALMNRHDAAERGLKDGDIIRLFNDRGACLAGLTVSDAVRPGVVQLATGAWYDPDESGMCRHGNPNVLTLDKGTSKLAQGPIAHTCLIQVERYRGAPPAVEVFQEPNIEHNSTPIKKSREA